MLKKWINNICFVLVVTIGTLCLSGVTYATTADGIFDEQVEGAVYFAGDDVAGLYEVSTWNNHTRIDSHNEDTAEPFAMDGGSIVANA